MPDRWRSSIPRYIISGLMLPVLALFPALSAAMAETPVLVIQAKKQGHVPALAEPQLDTSERKPLKFTIQETYRHVQPPKSQGPGIIGVDMLIRAGRYPVIQFVFTGTPAYHAGIMPGDTLVAVNGHQTIGKSLGEVDAMISDVPGERVSLTIERNGRLAQADLTVMAADALRPEQRSLFSSLFP